MKDKNFEENKSPELITDIHGRIESLDQSLRSVDNRLRAVEKRLSIKTPAPESDLIIIDNTEEKDACSDIEELQKYVETRINNLHLPEIESRIASAEAQLSDAEHRITKLENSNKIAIGRIKVPIELSGLVAALVLLGTGYLIYTDRWNIIRSSYYPVTIGILFGAVAIVKFVMSGRK